MGFTASISDNFFSLKQYDGLMICGTSDGNCGKPALVVHKFNFDRSNGLEVNQAVFVVMFFILFLVSFVVKKERYYLAIILFIILSVLLFIFIFMNYYFTLQIG